MRGAAAVRRRGPTAVFVGARRRALIIGKFSKQGHWKGKRGRMTITLDLVDTPTLANERVQFKCSIFREHMTGMAGTVQEAIDKLEEVYRDRMNQVAARPEKPKRKRKEPIA